MQVEFSDEECEVVVMALRDFAESETDYALDMPNPVDMEERRPVRERAELATAVADRLES